MADSLQIYPLYNTTYQIYRLSPLHHGDTPLLQDGALKTHARRLRDLLKGDNVRGVQVDFNTIDPALQAHGPLEECSWNIIGDEDAFIEMQRQVNDAEASQVTSVVTAELARGIEVKLNYTERAYNALLLRDPGATSSVPKFTTLPLLLIKMPVPIREIFLRYLSTAFDARAAPLKLASNFLMSTLESHLHRLTEPSSTQSIKDVIQQLKIQLTFPNTTRLLKSIDITIKSDDIDGFETRGKALAKDSDKKPFTQALSTYLKSHISLDMSNSKVQISKIECGAFVLGSEGRIKLTAPLPIQSDESVDGSMPETSAAEQAAQDLYSSLIHEASYTRFLPEGIMEDANAATPTSTGSKRVRRKRGISVTSSKASDHTAKRLKGRETGRRTRRTTEPEAMDDTDPPPPYSVNDPSQTN